MAEIETSSGHLAIITPNLQIRFLWVADHWKHEFLSSGTYHSIPRIWSVEGVAENEDHTKPAGPLYQHLDAKVEKSGAVVAHLTGQMGAHHYETKFLVEELGNEVLIEVDVTDRCPEPVADLSSTFLIEASEGKLIAGKDVTIKWHHPECRLDFEADPPATIEASEEGMGTIRLQVHSALDEEKHVHHFRYRWRWLSEEVRHH